MGAHLRVLGVVFNLKGLALALGIVGDGQLDGPDDSHDPLGGVVQIRAQAVLQEGVFHSGVRLGHADLLGEGADGGGGVAPAAQTADGGHTGIVPAGDVVLLHQLAQLALAHDRVVNAQPGKLDLTGLVVGNGDIVHHPVVEGTVGLEFQRAQGVGDALQRILNGVGEVVHGVDAPLVAGAVMMHVLDAVNGRIAHIEVAAGQIDLGPQRHGTVGELALAHALKQVEGLLDGAVTVGADGGGVHIAPVGAHLLGAELADIGEALFDELYRILIHLLEVVAGVVELRPFIAQPVDVLLNGVHELHILLGGVGVVHAQIAETMIFGRSAKVNEDRLGMADVQIAVGLRWEAGVHLHPLILSAGGEILVNKIVNKILAHDSVLQFVRHAAHSCLS